MQEGRFDRLTKSLACTDSRRSLLRAIGVGAAGLIAVRGGAAAQDADGGVSTDHEGQHRRFVGSGEGRVTEPAEDGCQFVGTGTTEFKGKGNNRPMGEVRFKTSLTADYSQAGPAPEGSGYDFCAPVRGRSRLEEISDDRRAVVRMNIRGKVCGQSEPGSTLTLEDGTYRIFQGTREFANARGSGEITGTVTGNKMTFTVDGDIVY